MQIFKSSQIISMIVTIVIICIIFSNTIYAGTLSCSVTTTCPTGAVIYRMSSTTNSHAELGTQSNYSNMICCTGVTGISNSCSGTFATALKLSSTTNAHAEKNTYSNFSNNACISVPSGGSISIGYQTTNCTGYDTTLGSIESDTNSHIGDASSYTNKICGTANGTQSLTFSISDNTIGFDGLLSVSARYATGDTLGSGTDTVDAHTLSASSNTTGGYFITIQGTTLTSGAETITAIGGTALSSSVGTKQFGMRMLVNSGTGATASPYNTSNWAFDIATFPDTIATGSGDGNTSVYGVRYLSNISASTVAGTYSSVLTYVMTAGF